MDVCRIKGKSSNGDGVSTMVDLNDVFDDIVLAENNSFHRGFQEGVEKSRAQGFADGFGLGLGKGLQVGTSIGYYRQFAELALRSLELSRKETQAGDTFNSQQIQEISSFPIARKEKLEQSLKSLSPSLAFTTARTKPFSPYWRRSNPSTSKRKRSSI